MRAFKLSALAIAMGLGVTTAQASNVSVPESKGGFNVGIEGNYLRPTNSDLEYALNKNSEAGKRPYKIQSHSVEPGYDFGFGVNVGYTFPGTGLDINARYNRLSTDDSNSVTKDSLGKDQQIDSVYAEAGGVKSDINGEVFDALKKDLAKKYSDLAIEGTAGGDAKQLLQKVDGKVDFTLDDFEVTLGQKVNFCNLNVRLYGGVGYAKLEEDLDITAHYNKTSRNVVEKDNPGTSRGTAEWTNKVTENYHSDFSGIGPVAGIDGFYNLANGFGVVAGINGGLLVGEIESSYHKDGHSTATYAIDKKQQYSSTYNQRLKEHPSKKEKRVVPTLGANLGLQYAHSLNNNYQLALEGGYKVKTYFNAKDRVNTQTYKRETSSYTVDGPYLQLKLLAA